ncbi:MAG: IS1595 family transposase [Marinifilaceae bacterium]|jgi:transposase-like protein|nr:IS1595 family transposase [Marinifilaceae bacterium]
MKSQAFKELIKKIELFNNLEFRLLKEKIEERIYSKRVSYILETPERDLICPFCKSINYIKWGKRNDMQRYLCKDCNKTFNSLTNTPLARLRRKGHWLAFSNCLKEGLSVRKAASECGIHKNTSFRWRHRFLYNAKYIKANKLGGIVENSYLKLKESFKGSKNIKKLNQNRKDIYVVYGIDRTNNIFDITNKGFSSKLLVNTFNSIIHKNSLVLSDRNQHFKEYSKTMTYKHSYLSTISDKLTYFGHVNTYKTSFLKWINEKFMGVATKYLENYVSWFRFLNEFNSGINSITVLYRAKSVEKYRHQPLKMTRFL